MDQSSNGGGVPECVEDEDQVEVIELEEDPDGMLQKCRFFFFFFVNYEACFQIVTRFILFKLYTMD